MQDLILLFVYLVLLLAFMLSRLKSTSSIKPCDREVIKRRLKRFVGCPKGEIKA